VNDIWELGDSAESILGEIIGRGNALKILQFCGGKDDRAVTPAARKSIGAECNYGVRFDGPYGVDYMLAGLSKEVEKRMTLAAVRGSKLVLKVMKSRDASKQPGKFLGKCINDLG
jgi:DNA repair protein REV1